MTTPTAGAPAHPIPETEPGATAPGGPAADPILCFHCGRTAGNGISCQGFCVADSDY
jgi:hypothetical protein